MTNTTVLPGNTAPRLMTGHPVADLTELLAAYVRDELEARATGIWL
jgi:hypothetical protein